jgi:hypothetical protein
VAATGFSGEGAWAAGAAWAGRMASEHRVVVGGGVGDDQQNVPVPDYLALVVEAEDVAAGIVFVSRPRLVAAQDDIGAASEELLTANRRLGP